MKKALVVCVCLWLLLAGFLIGMQARKSIESVGDVTEGAESVAEEAPLPAGATGAQPSEEEKERAAQDAIAAAHDANTWLDQKELPKEKKKSGRVRVEGLDLHAYEAGEILAIDADEVADAVHCFFAEEIAAGDDVYARINGRSYQENPYIPLAQLRYLKMLHYNYEGKIQVGEMIVNQTIAEDVQNIFKELFLMKYQIYQMRLVEEFWDEDALKTDDASCAANNTSCFSYRVAANNASVLSNHALGRAIDINPVENPFIVFQGDGSVRLTPEGSEEYMNNRNANHAINHEDAAYQIFVKYGFSWGGNWTSPIDYQHFEKA